VLRYAPGAGNCPAVALPCGVRADQTCLALFFFLRLGRQSRLTRIDRHFRNTTGTGVHRRAVPPRRRNQKKGRKNVGRTQHDPKTAIVIPIARVIPVAVGAAGVVSMIVPRAAPHDLSRLPDRMSPPGQAKDSKKSRVALRAAGKVSPAPPPESEYPE
jgi:hypothetical protein